MKFLFITLFAALLLSCESPTMRTGEPGCVYRDMTGQEDVGETEPETATVTITIQ